MQGIDRLMSERGYSDLRPSDRALLPLVEQIDPALVPEYFWRIVAMRPPSDPRRDGLIGSASLALVLGWYDREVAETVLIKHDRSDLLPTGDKWMAPPAAPFLAWAMLAPRLAVAGLERFPVHPMLDLTADYARRSLAETLQLPHEARWRSIFLNHTEMSSILAGELY